jgi:Major tropism determinant N-terminal domain
MPRLQIKRGLKANLPTASMLPGEAHFTTDRGTLHVATGATTKLAIVPAIDDLATIGSVDGAADLLILHDASGTGQKEGKITVNAFKAALNIPSSDLDEKVAVVAGGVSGYIFGTNGTDGVIRLNPSMVWSKDSGNAFVTLAVGDVDCGTF